MVARRRESELRAEYFKKGSKTLGNIGKVLNFGNHKKSGLLQNSNSKNRMNKTLAVPPKSM